MTRRQFVVAAGGIAAFGVGGLGLLGGRSGAPPVPRSHEASIRRATLQSLSRAGFTVAGSLPLWSEWSGRPVVLRPKIEIVRRLMCLDAFILFIDSDANAESDIRGHVRDAGLEDSFNDAETAAFGGTRTAARSRHAGGKGWFQEARWALSWVLGYDRRPGVRDGFIDATVDGPLQSDFLPGLGESPESFAALHGLRPATDVLGLHDLFYCAHNAVRSARQRRDTVPDGFDPVRDGGVVHEKRHALTWCLSPGVAWDDVDLAT